MAAGKSDATQDGNQILVVDDDPQLLQTLRMRLSLSGYRVSAVESAEKALASMALALPDLLITDVRMGGMDGMKLFEHVHRQYPSLPVIIMTAHASIPDAVDATRRGVFGYLAKPTDAKDLLHEVERALALSSGSPIDATPDDDWRRDILTRSALVEATLAKVRLVARTDASVLITGASGTGKELLATAIHRASARRAAPFVAINCGAIPEQLLESELFGHVKGAFSGAARDHKGLFQAAEAGTLFLDEIGDMPLALQVKLLRVLQERKVRPVGATHSLPIDVRLIAATHRDLDDEVRSARFREDLYYRLNVVKLTLPPLAERREDIPLLAAHFARTLGARYSKAISGIAPDAMALLSRQAWPGNVRQLHNIVEQCVALTTSALIDQTLVEEALNQRGGEMASLDEAKLRFERDYLICLLKLVRGNVSQAARMAQRNRSEFYNLLRRHELDPITFKSDDR